MNDLRMCTHCMKEFPQHLIQPLYTTTKGWEYVDPICALKARNELHGLPEGTPFQGEQAKEMYEEALRYVGDGE